MKSIQSMREQRAFVATDIKKLINDTEGKTWDSSNQDIYDAKMLEIDSIDAEIARTEGYLNKAAEKAADGDMTDLIDQNIKTEGAHSENSKAFRAYLAGGLNNINESGLMALKSRQTPDIRAAMSVGTGSEGGFTVAEEFYRRLTEAMKAFGGIRSVATIMQTATGAPMNFPATDSTAEIGEIVGENAAVSQGDTTFTNLILDVHKYSSKKIVTPFELIQDSMFDLESYILKVIALRLGRIIAQHCTTGTGSGQPRGIVTASDLGIKGATGSSKKVSYDDLVALIHSVDPLYRMNAGFMMNDDSIRILRTLKDTTGRPLFVPGYETGVPGGAPDMILGEKITISQEMPKMAANAKSILYGDFSKYIIREVMDLTTFRMADSNFILNGQIGFVGFNRQGGNLIDTGGAVKHYQNSAA